MEYKTKNGVDMLLKKSSPRSDKNKQTKKSTLSPLDAQDNGVVHTLSADTGHKH